MASEERTYKFDAFVSYASADYALVRKLESFLESFHRISRVTPTISLQPLQICVDGSDFRLQRKAAAPRHPNDSGLLQLIEEHLRVSRWLIVVCSAAAKQSRWVDAEVQWFLEHRDTAEILLVIASGRDPVAEADEILSRRMLAAALTDKPWYDLRGYQAVRGDQPARLKAPDDELIRLAAHLNGVTAGEVQPVWYRDRRRRRRRMLAAVGAAVVVLAGVTAFGAIQWNDASLRRLLSNAGGYVQTEKARTTLYFDKDAEADSVMPAVVRLAPFHYVDVSQTNFSDRGLVPLSKVRSIESLTLAHTQVTGAGLTHLRELVNLRVLQLDGLKLRDADIQHLCVLAKLETLDLSDTPIRGEGLKCLSSLRNMRKLALTRTNVDDASLRHLAGLSGLEELDIALTRVTDVGLDSIPLLPRLRVLNAERTEIGGEGLRALGALPRLEELWLRGAAVTDLGLKALTSCPALRVLAVPNTRITDSGLVHLRALPTLQRLYIGGTRVTNDGLAEIAQLPALEVLWLWGNTAVTDAGIDRLTSLKRLREIRLTRTGVSPGAIARLKAQFPDLKVITTDD